jgi:hypothetical protein
VHPQFSRPRTAIAGIQGSQAFAAFVVMKAGEWVEFQAEPVGSSQPGFAVELGDNKST